ncbi:uncharacterized protein METZ01_LOCUS287951, partial [marine metagenome]
MLQSQKLLAPAALLAQLSPAPILQTMKRILFTLLLIGPFVLSAQTPLWIWPDRAEKTETVYFRKVVELPAGKIKSAKLQATCDNGFSLFVNGKPALAG